MSEHGPIDTQDILVPDSLKVLRDEFVDAFEGKGYQGKKQVMKNAGFVLSAVWPAIILLFGFAGYLLEYMLILSVVISVFALFGLVFVITLTVGYFGNAKRLRDAERHKLPYRLASELSALRNPHVLYTGVIYFNIDTLDACIKVWNWYLEQKAAGNVPKTSLREHTVYAMILQRVRSMRKIMKRIDEQGIEVVGWIEDDSSRYFTKTMPENPIADIEYLRWRTQRLLEGSPLVALMELHVTLTSYESRFAFVNRHLLAPSRK
jgi:hypothetical protein